VDRSVRSECEKQCEGACAFNFAAKIQKTESFLIIGIFSSDQ
jgi:hypothetical protein